jgi:hypothetical protein
VTGPSAPLEPVDPRADRQAALVAFLRGAGVVCFVLAVAALVPGEAGRVARGGVLGLLLAVPLARALWLAARWAVKGDGRYAAVAVAAAAIAACGAVVG